MMETESPAASEELRNHGHSHNRSNHSRHSSGGDSVDGVGDSTNVNAASNNNNNNNNSSHPDAVVEPDFSSEDGDFGSEIGGEEPSAWIARASQRLCEDSQGATAGIGVGGVGGVGGLGAGGPEDGTSPPLQGEVNVTLWQFLLELLMSRQYSHVIQWTNREGEFQLLRAEEVARLWGMRKNKNHRMNYDKLSRALRYYYQKNIIKKVQGQKFVYRFVGLSDSILRAPQSLSSAAAAAAAANAAAGLTNPSDCVSPKLEAVDDDLPTSPQLEEPSATVQVPMLHHQAQQPKAQPLTPPTQPASVNARRLWQGGHHHIQHPQQQHQGLDLSLPHATAAAAALLSASAASAAPQTPQPPPPPPPPPPLHTPVVSKRLRGSTESAGTVSSPESPPAKRPCCACRCHETMQAESPAAAAATVSTPRIKTEPTAAAAATAATEAAAGDSTDGVGLPSNYIQWLTLELAGGAAGLAGGGGAGGVAGGGGGGGPSFLHSSRHAANMKKLAEHIRLQKMLKRPSESGMTAVSSAPSSSTPSSAAASHSLSHHPHHHAAAAAAAAAASFHQSNGSPFSPPGCVWMPVPVAMLSQLWAGQEAAAAAAAVAASSAAAAAAAAAAANTSTAPSSSASGGGLEDQGD